MSQSTEQNHSKSIEEKYTQIEKRKHTQGLSDDAVTNWSNTVI